MKVLLSLIWRLSPSLIALIILWWRIESPIDSYSTLMNLSDYGMGFVLSSVDQLLNWNLAGGILQSTINLFLVDQFNGILTGIIIANIFSLLWWALISPFRVIGSLFKRKKSNN